MITYHYVFKNPIGSSWSFSVDWDANLKDTYASPFVSAITLHQSTNWGPGTVFTFNDGAWTRDGQPVTDPGSIRAAVFTSTPADTGVNVGPAPVPDFIPFAGVDLTVSPSEGLFKEFWVVPQSYPTTPDGKPGFLATARGSLNPGKALYFDIPADT